MLLLLALATLSQQALHLPAVFGDGAVFQRGAPLRLWGWAVPGAEVTLGLSWSDREHVARADELGVFAFVVPPAEDPGPHRLRLAQGGQERVVEDVLFGEVWLCAGQSNMEMTVGGAVPADNPRLGEADLPRLRVFDVPKAFEASPVDAPRHEVSAWRSCTPDTVRDFSAVATYFGADLLEQLDVPVGLVTATWGATVGEAWLSARGLAPFEECAADLERLAALRGVPTERRPTWLHPNRPSVLYNAMIAPLAPGGERRLSLRGVILYHGESNRGRAERYGELLPALIADWRAAFAGPEMPFYFVQIAPFDYPRDRGEAALLRDVQRRTLRVPNTGMAVTMDVGDPGSLHPVRKRQVGQRLARWALAKTYAKSDLEYSGPLFRGWKREGPGMRLFFDHANGLRTEKETLEHFTVAGADGILHPARARIDGETILVSSDAVPEPVEVRFGGGAGDETSLLNAAGLPAASFIGDGRDRLE